ncbi:uncharacterized protein LOC129591423 [Paramacrobiotus metropolitanus]|uniref:uncharacterized protein LOC129591423 n=1 Tax=Paramacrobiotus metropolitanus TaxID=2943436 RepID=UPI002445E214|nr:uncharacterized protein LOC129591423 [Paramacrobiotus metropolitanus]
MDSFLSGLEKPCAVAYDDPLADKVCRFWQQSAYPVYNMYRTFCPDFPSLNFNHSNGVPKEVVYLYLCKWSQYTKELSPRTFEATDCDADPTSDHFVSRLRPEINNCPPLDAIIQLTSRGNEVCAQHNAGDSVTLAGRVCGWWNDQDGKMQEIVRHLNVEFCHTPSEFVDYCRGNTSRIWFFHASSALAKSTTAAVLTVTFPVLLAFATIGNVISIMVFASVKEKKRATVYLLVICVGDILHMWFQIPRYISIVNRLILKEHVTYDRLIGFVNLVLHVAKDMSDWALLIFSVERSMSILRPLQNRERGRTKPAWITMLVILVVLIAINAVDPVASQFILSRSGVRVYELMYRDVPAFDAAYPLWIQHWMFAAVIYRTLKIVAIFVILLAADSFVIITVIKRQRALKEHSRKGHIGGTNTIIIFSTTLYLLTQVVALVNELLVVSYITCLLHKDHYSYETYWNVYPVQNALSDINHSLNFLFYARSKSFRAGLMMLLDPVKKCNSQAVFVSF